MQKILLTLLIFTFILSCKKESKDITDVEKDNKNQNEMVASMDRTMIAMHSNAPVGNNDADYSKMMIEHHKGAVEMAKIELSKGKDLQLRKFAEQVIGDQGKEIDLMQKFVHEATPSSDSQSFVADLNSSMSAMIDNTIKVHNDTDKDFAEQMIPHHRSAVDMAKVYLKYGKNQQLLKLSNDIVRNQNSEIAMLQDWLKKN